MEEATSLRDAIECGVGSLNETLVGIGLSLSYHLVLALGVIFHIPTRLTALVHLLKRMTWPSAQAHVLFRSKKRVASRNQANEANGRQMKFFREQPITPVPIPVKSIASSGLQAMDPPSILVVEDTEMCAKLMCMVLRKALCSATWVDNGQKAVDLLRESVPGMYSLILMDENANGWSDCNCSHQERSQE
jgi:PleD family two-component response regulator